MSIRMSLWAAVVLGTFSFNVPAQSVLPPILGSTQGAFGIGPEFPEAKPFGTTIKQLPGQKVPNASAIKGEWFHRALRRNVMLENEWTPQLATSLRLELHPDGGYTLEYQASWGALRATNDPRFAGIEVEERGRFSLSGGILLLRPENIAVTRQEKGVRSRVTLANENRAYVVRLERAGNFLHMAGPCARYQVEPVCRSARSVWFALRGLGPRGS